MTAEDYIQAYRRFADLSERLFGEGDDRAGAEMLYGALSQIIIAIAVLRGEAFREHRHRRHIIRTLSGELSAPSLVDDFGEAQRLHVHFYLNDLHDADFINAVAATHSLINRLLPLASRP